MAKAASQNGWIKLHRSIMSHWVYESYEMQHYWIDLLFLVNHKAKKYPVNKKLVTIEAGQRLTSLRKLADRWDIDKNTVKKVLDTFQKDGMITIENKFGGTVITVVNYRAYQGSKGDFRDTDSDTLSDTLSYTDSDTVTDTVSDADSTQTRMSKNDIKNDIKNEKEKTAPRYDPWGYELEE